MFGVWFLFLLSSVVSYTAVTLLWEAAAGRFVSHLCIHIMWGHVSTLSS